MAFTKLHDGIDCNCLTEAFENSTECFARKIDDAKTLKNKFFLSHHERGKKPITNDCKDLCETRGVSLDIWTDKSKALVYAKFQKSYELAPMYKKALAIIRIKEKNGLVKYTPNQEEFNEFHYDLIKPDDFDISTHLELVEIKKPGL